MESSVSNTMIKLVASTYSIWKPMIEVLLYCKDLYDLIELKGNKPEKTGAKEWKKLNRKDVGMLRQWVRMFGPKKDCPK